ncbi:MAG: hypothetical protein HYR96_08320 [Deltaproteobacteria bacterium]|nr:hypothetical protein [Deltaproteobacteria bacterium]MBI3294969.1 hypothetical protein [Deltaproteobacteria bacterium]
MGGNCFLAGGVFISALLCALYFLRFWKESADRFYLFFSVAFILFGLERLPVLFEWELSDSGGSVYIIRLLAFILILVAIADKNLSVKEK